MTATPTLQAPFPYFGGKSRIASAVWARFGAVRNYVEPFFGSGANLLARPQPFEGSETVNDKCGFIANFWRAVGADAETVAAHADHPVNENDLHARHAWLVAQAESLQSRLEGDPDWYDAKVAGWWCWGMCCWIGSGFCSGKGPWQVVEVDGVRKLVHLGNAGRGVHRKRVHLGNAGLGVHRKLVHLGDAGQGGDGLYKWFAALMERLRHVRVCCGDWERVCGDTPTVKQGCTAVFLDPPYLGETNGDDGVKRRHGDLYRQEDLTIAHRVRDWCLERGDDKRFRIALCGYEGEHEELEGRGWSVLAWKTKGGYGSQGSQGSQNASRERVWFSPHCVGAPRSGLFDDEPQAAHEPTLV